MATQEQVKDQLKKAAEVEKTAPQRTIREMLMDPVQQAEFARAIPTAMTPERFARIGLTAINSSPNLLKCTSTSLMAGLMQAAALGLEPNTPLQQCWLLPFENRSASRFDVQFILGYRGILTLALRSPSILDVQAREVYAADDFEYELGLNEKLRHVPVFEDQTIDDVVVYYGIVRYQGGGHYWRLVKPSTIEEHRKRSKSPDSPAWKNDKLPMALKTVIRIMAPYMPLSPEAAAGLAADGTAPTSIEEIVIPDEDYLDVESHEGEPELDTPPADEDRCAECGDVDGAHQPDCSKAPAPKK